MASAILALAVVALVTELASCSCSASLPTNVNLVAVGGSNNQTQYIDNVDVISISTNTHNSAASLPEGLNIVSTTLLNDTTVYAVGTIKWSANGSDTHSMVASYDISANKWTSLGNFPYDVTQNVLVTVNGTIYSLCGMGKGRGWMTNPFEYDADTNSWQELVYWPLPDTKLYDCCAVVRESSIFLLLQPGRGTTDMYRSDDGARTWTKFQSMATDRYFSACTVLQNGKIMVAGGNQFGAQLNSVELLDVETNSWQTTAAMQRGRESFQLVTLPSSRDVEDLVVGCGGEDRDSDALYADCELYNVAKQQWMLADFGMNMPRVGFGMFVNQTF